MTSSSVERETPAETRIVIPDLDLIEYLRTKKDEKIGVVAFVNHLPHDNYHFELITEGENNQLDFKPINEASFTKGLNWFEKMMQGITGLSNEGEKNLQGETIENGALWRKRQIEALEKTDDVQITPLFRSFMVPPEPVI
jgi:hypothetical protein